MTKKIVVLGAGQSAASFLAKYRSLDLEAEITLIGNETSLPYQRPPLSKKYATGGMSADQLLLRPENWYEQNKIKTRLGVNIESLDLANKSLALSSTEQLQWDQLFLSTGSTPRKLPAAIGGELPGVYTLRSLEDADQFSGELQEGRRVAIIGGGYIGLEAAAVCASKGLKVTLVEAADRILQRVACAETSDWFRKLHQDHGVTIYEGKGLDKFEEANGKVSAAVFSDGDRCEVDFVLVGIGIIPNVELATNAGLEVDGGIVLDENCCTSNADVYAAGDCAAFQYRGHLTRLESVQNAIDQAETAAENMAGNVSNYQPYPWFWSDQYDVKLQIAGLNRGYDKIVTRIGEREGSISHFYFEGEALLAVDAINDPRTYMVSKKMLEGGKNLTPEQAADTDLQLKSLM